MAINEKSKKYIQIGEFRDVSRDAHESNEEFTFVVQKMAEQRNKIDEILVRSRSYQTSRQLLNNYDQNWKNTEIQENNKEMTFGGGIQRKRERSVGSINRKNSLISKIQGYEIEANSTVEDMRRRIQTMKTKKGDEGWSPQQELYRLTNDFSRIDIRKQGKHASSKKYNSQKQSRIEQNHQTLSPSISPLSNNSPSIQFEIIEPQLNNVGSAIKSDNKLVFNPSQQVSSQKYPQNQSPQPFSYASILNQEQNRPRSLMKQVKTQQSQLDYSTYLQQDSIHNSFSQQKMRTLPKIFNNSNLKKTQFNLDNDLTEQKNLRLDSFPNENNQSKGKLQYEDINEGELFRINKQPLGLIQQQKNNQPIKRTKRAKSSLGKFETMINNVRGVKREEIKKVYMGVPQVEGTIVWKTSENKQNKGAKKRSKTRLDLLENDLFKVRMGKEKIPAMENLSEFNYLNDNSFMFGQNKQQYSDEIKRNQDVNFNLYYSQHEDLIRQQSNQTLEMLDYFFRQSQFTKKIQLAQSLAEFKQNFTLLAEQQDQCIRSIKMQHQHFNNFYMPSECDLTEIP